MIFKALKESTKTLILRPYILLPMIIISIISYLLADATAGLLQGYLTDVILYGETILQLDPVLFILGNYPIEVILLIIAGIIMLFATTIAFVSISKFSGKKSFVDSINSSVMEWKRSLGLVIFGAIVLAILFAIWLGAISVLNWINTLSGSVLGPIIYYILLPIITIILIIIFSIKLAFILPAFSEGNKVRDAIQKSWEVTTDSFWNAFIYVVILVIINYLIYQAFLFLSLNIIELEIVLLSAGEIISTTFFILGISYYYYLR